MEPSIPVDLVERVSGLRVALEEFEKVLTPFLSGNGTVVESVEVALGVRKEVLKTSDGALKVEEEVGALLVRNGAESIVGVLTVLESRDKALEAWVVCDCSSASLRALEPMM